MVTADPATIALVQARMQALKMRRAHLTYTAISYVMREYHGIDRCPEAWRSFCRAAGCPPSRRGSSGQFKAAA